MDKVLKQRLIGASILIALAVIFLPMLFDGGSSELSDPQDFALDLPERQTGERQVRRLSLDPQQARRPASRRLDEEAEDFDAGQIEPAVRATPAEPPQASEPVRSAGQGQDADGASSAQPAEEPPAPVPEVLEPEVPAPLESAPQPAAAQPGSEPEPKSGPEPAAAPAPPQAASSADPDGHWVVQVAVFSNHESADLVASMLDGLGHKVMIDLLLRNEAELIRLRTGPYAEQADAEKARGQIEATVAGVEPVVRELSTEGQVDQRRGYAVQVGSFGGRKNAERRQAELQALGLDAFIHGEPFNDGFIWRVRVGMHEARSDAEHELEALRRDGVADGFVVSHP